MTSDAKKCVPFNLNGKTYERCTRRGMKSCTGTGENKRCVDKGMLWCATSVKGDGTYDEWNWC